MTTNDSGAIPDAEPLAAATDLAVALRDLIETAVTTTAPTAEVRAAADLVRQVTERLAVTRRPASRLPALDDVTTGRRVFNPVTGAASPLAPPLVVRRDGDGVVGRATLGVAYEGPPSFVHGGMSALLMDQLLGSAAAAAGLWGMTAHLELDYRGPLPLEQELVLRAGVAENSGAEVGHHRHDRRGHRPRPGPRRGAGRVRAAATGEGRGLLRRDHRRVGPAHPAPPPGGRDRPRAGLSRYVASSDVAVAASAARAAAEALLALRSGGLRGRALGDAGDAAAQQAITAVLAAERPADVVFSEEAVDDRRRLSADRVWIVDPLDGTREYGDPDRHDWAVHVALWSAGALTAAAVALPALGEILVTDPAPAPPRPAGRLRLTVSRSRPPVEAQVDRRGAGRGGGAARFGRLQDPRRRPG